VETKAEKIGMEKAEEGRKKKEGNRSEEGS